MDEQDTQTDANAPVENTEETTTEEQAGTDTETA